MLVRRDTLHSQCQRLDATLGPRLINLFCVFATGYRLVVNGVWPDFAFSREPTVSERIPEVIDWFRAD